jgi:hypothetical protein
MQAKSMGPHQRKQGRIKGRTKIKQGRTKDRTNKISKTPFLPLPLPPLPLSLSRTGPASASPCPAVGTACSRQQGTRQSGTRGQPAF